MALSGQGRTQGGGGLWTFRPFRCDLSWRRVPPVLLEVFLCSVTIAQSHSDWPTTLPGTFAIFFSIVLACHLHPALLLSPGRHNWTLAKAPVDRFPCYKNVTWSSPSPSGFSLWVLSLLIMGAKFTYTWVIRARFSARWCLRAMFCFVTEHRRLPG